MRACLVAVASLLVLVLGLSLAPVAAQKAPADKHDPAAAVANLDIHKDLSATRFASEPMITNPGGAQHDHSAHSFVFGPDGKYYWNFGNTGGGVSDKDGKQIVDIEGAPVNSARNPFMEGMVFRCDPDGSNFELLGYNFRNNY